MARPDESARTSDDSVTSQRRLISERWDFETLGIYLKPYSLFSGALIALFIFVVGNYLRIWEVEFVSHPKWIRGSIAIYLGGSIGYYLGKTSKNQEKELDVDSLLLGFFIVLTAGLLFSGPFSDLLILFAIPFGLVITLYRSGLIPSSIEESSELERVIEYSRRSCLAVASLFLSYNILLVVATGIKVGKNKLISLAIILAITILMLIFPKIYNTPTDERTID